MGEIEESEIHNIQTKYSAEGIETEAKSSYIHEIKNKQ